MTHTYYVNPSTTRRQFAKHWGGIQGSIKIHNDLLPQFGWEETQDEYGADLVIGYLSTSTKRLDVFHLRGLYPTAEIKFGAGFWSENGKIIENLRRARHVICVSEWVADILRRDMHMQPYVVPGHGIDLEYWDSLDRYSRSDLKPYALWNKSRGHGVCDPEPVKVLASHFPYYQFVTTFWPRGEAIPNNVTVTGVMPYEKMWPVVKGASIYLATTKETFGRGTLEAMASESAIVGFDWGATPDVLDDTGILVQPGDYDALCEAFERMQHEGSKFGQRARRHVEELFGWENIVRETAAVYDLVLRDLEIKNRSPKVSVVIPCHNYAHYIAQAISSVRAQTFRDFECIIVNDGSQDNSGEVIHKAIVGDERFQYVYQDNAGVAVARNHGISKASGEFVCCLDADDAMASTLLETLVPALEADPRLGIVYTGVTIMSSDGQLYPHKNNWPRQYRRERGLMGNQVPTCCLFRRSWWKRVGGYRQRFAPYGAGQEDSDFWVRILANGGGAKKVTDEGLFHHRRHKLQTTRVHRDYWAKDRYPAWYPFYGDHQHPIASQLGVAPYNSWPVRNYDCPEIGVVIPVGSYHINLLTDVLDSVEAQTFRNWEVVVVNDTGQELDLTPWPYAKVVSTEGSRGPAYARNIGTEALKAPLVVYLDADDWLQADALETFVWAFHDADDECWIYPDIYIMHPSGTMEWYKSPDWNLDALLRTGVAPITICCSVDMWREAGGFTNDPTLLREDWDFHLRLANAGFCGVRVKHPLFTYRHASSKRRKGWKDVASRREEVTRILAHYEIGELKAMCRGCGGKSSSKRKPVPPPPGNWVEKVEAGWVRLEYIGLNKNTLVFKGRKTRYKYRAGLNPHHRFVDVHPDDAPHLLKLNYFRETPRPLAKDILEASATPKAHVVLRKETYKPVDNGRLNINDLTVADIMALELDAGSWRDLQDQEESREKPRKTVLSFIGRRLRKAEVGVSPT